MKIFGTICVCAGFIFMLGCVGSVDCHTMTLMQGTIRAIIGLAVMGLGTLLLNLGENRR